MIPPSIHVKKVKIANYHLGQIFWPVSQIRIQCNMLGFLVEGHILYTHTVIRILETVRGTFMYPKVIDNNTYISACLGMSHGCVCHCKKQSSGSPE